LNSHKKHKKSQKEELNGFAQSSDTSSRKPVSLTTSHNSLTLAHIIFLYLLVFFVAIKQQQVPLGDPPLAVAPSGWHAGLVQE
jgi:hypothetical protein